MVWSGVRDVRSESNWWPPSAVIAVASLVATAGSALSSPRVFATAARCEEARVLPAGACRVAFANALAEYAARAPSYRSRRACFKAFGPCMPWPIGTTRYDAFRPQWVGASVEAGQVTPATAPGRLDLRFTPRSASVPSPDATTRATAAAAPAVRIMSPDDDAARDAIPPARPGGGFEVIDGVLTYPAPARFQPRNLKHP